MTTGDRPPRARFAVRFVGDMSAEAAKALRRRHMGPQTSDSFFAEPIPYSTTVVVLAADADDAVTQVRDALEGLGEFSGFEAVAFSRRHRDD
jgi:hypothetical protein